MKEINFDKKKVKYSEVLNKYSSCERRLYIDATWDEDGNLTKRKAGLHFSDIDACVKSIERYIVTPFYFEVSSGRKSNELVILFEDEEYKFTYKELGNVEDVMAEYYTFNQMINLPVSLSVTDNHHPYTDTDYCGYFIKTTSEIENDKRTWDMKTSSLNNDWMRSMLLFTDDLSGEEIVKGVKKFYKDKLKAMGASEYPTLEHLLIDLERSLQNVTIQLPFLYFTTEEQSKLISNLHDKFYLTSLVIDNS